MSHNPKLPMISLEVLDNVCGGEPVVEGAYRSGGRWYVDDAGDQGPMNHGLEQRLFSQGVSYRHDPRRGRYEILGPLGNPIAEPMLARSARAPQQ